MAKDIGQRIVLEGEKEYKAALTDAYRNLRTLRTELKAETAELGNNATAQQKAEVRAKSLRQQIQEQEKIVQTYKKALDEVKTQHGDNEAAIASWEQKLNLARATLAGMQNDLDGLGDSMKNLSVDSAAAVTATKSVADAIGKISSIGGSVADGIESIFTRMVDTIADAVSEVWGLITATAQKANQWTDIAGFWHTDTQQIQQYARALAATGNQFSDLEANMTRIVLGDHNKIRKLTGVKWVGDADQWQYAMDVLSSLADMDYQKRTEAIGKIFGSKKYPQLMEILNDWHDIQGLLGTYNGNETGYGMTDAQLQQMNDLYVKIETVEQKWEALKDRFAAGLGTATFDLLVNVEGVLDGISEYMTAEDDAGREAALQKIRTNLENFFSRLGQMLSDCVGILRSVGEDLQKSDDPVTKALGDILSGVASALEWIVNNQETVIHAFEAIFGMWLIAKIAAVAGEMTNLIANINVIKGFNGWKGNLTGGPVGGGSGAGGVPTGTGGGAGSAGVGTQTVSTQNVSSQNASNQNVTTGNVTTQNVTTGNVTTENVTTGNVTTENVTTGNVTTQTVTTGNVTTETVNTASFATATTSTESVGTMTVGTLIASNGLPGGASYPSLPGGTPTGALPAGGSVPRIDAGVNGFVPFFAPGGLPSGSGGSGSGIGNGYSLGAGGGHATAGLPAGQSVPKADYVAKPGDFSIGPAGGGNPSPAPATEPPAPKSGGPSSILSTAAWGLLPAMGVLAAALVPAAVIQLQNEQQWKETQRAIDEAVEKIEEAGVNTPDAEFIRRANNVTGPWRNPDGSYQTDITGLFGVSGLTDEHDDLLMGLQARQNQQRAELANAIHQYAPYTAGYNTWDLLNRYWTDKDLDPYQVEELTENIMSALQQAAEAKIRRMEQDLETQLQPPEMNSSWLRYLNADMWRTGGGSSQEGITHGDMEGFRTLPLQLQKAAKEGTMAGISNIRVYMDGAAVGYMVAPYVSQEIAKGAG